MAGSTKYIYLATKSQKIKLWFVAGVCIVCSLFTCFMVFGITPSDIRQDHISIYTARAWQAVLLLVGNVMLGGMLYLSGRYVLQIEEKEDGSLMLELWTIIGITKKVLLAAGSWEQRSSMHEGQSNFLGTPMVDAPWIGLKTKKGKRYVIDADGDFPQSAFYFFSIIEGEPV